MGATLVVARGRTYLRCRSGRDKPVPYVNMRRRLLGAVCAIALAGCMNRFPGQGPDGYRTMSCDELMERLAAFDEKVKQAMAELAEHGQSAERQQAMRRRLREESQELVREINRRCPARVEPRIL